MLVELVNHYRPYIMPLAVSCAVHIGIAGYGGFSRWADPEIQLKSGKSVVELTLMPSTPSKASVAAKKVESSPQETDHAIIDEPDKPAEVCSNELPEKKLDQFISSPLKKIQPKTVRCDNISVAKTRREKSTEQKTEISKNTEKKNTVKPDIKDKAQKQVEQSSPVNGQVNSVDSPLVEADKLRKGVSCECEMKSELLVKYPRVSRRKNEEGSVDLNIKIDECGNVTKVQVITSSGYKRLDKSAVKSIKSAKFTPALKNGKNVVSELKMNITFKLDDFDE